MVDFLTGEQRDSLIELYIAYFNRAPESGGLSFHANAVIEDLNAGLDFQAALNNRADNFFSAAIDLGVYSNAMTADEFVAEVYENTLLRPGVGGDAPTEAELSYWTARLESGEIGRGDLVTEFLDSIPFLLENGTPEEQETVAQVQAVLENRVEVARVFSMPENSGGLSGQEAIAAGKAAIAGVDATEESVQEAIQDIEDGSVGEEGDSLTLSTDAGEVLDGTASDDTFNAVISATAADNTINNFDEVNGGAGRDTLNVIVDGDITVPSSASFESIEVVNLLRADADATSTVFSADTFGDAAEEIWQIGTAGDVEDISDDQTVGFRDIDISATQAVNLSFDGEIANVAVDGDDQLEFNIVDQDTGSSDVDLTTLNVSGSTDGFLEVGTLPAALETLNLSLDTDTDISVQTAATLSSVVTIDASGSEGDLIVDLTGATDLSLENLTLGSGGDEVSIAGQELAADAVSVDLGAGNDTFTLTDDGTADATMLSATLGAGNDLVDVSAGTSNIASADESDFADGLFAIEDFDVNEDEIDLGAATFAGNILQGNINDAGSLFEALGEVDGSVVFGFEGDTYIYTDNNAPGFDADDGLVKLTGVSVEDLQNNPDAIA